MEINKFVKITNSNQFEVNVGYLTDKSKKTTKYTLNIYTFLPKNLDINSETYSQNDFYDDSTSYIRLITPRYDLMILTDRLATFLDFLKVNINVEDKYEYINYELKMIVCSYITFLKDISAKVENNTIELERILLFVDRLIELKIYKEILFECRKDTENEDIIHLIKSAIEYMSMITQNYLFKISVALRKRESINNEMIVKILNIINEEITFQKKNNMSIISTDDLMNEEVIFRYAVFKKYFYSILYLNKKKEKDSVRMQQVYYAIAAGISMVFATTIIFITQQKYGNFTTAFFASLVVSYMFKDRLKDFFKQYFENRLRFKMYDFKEKIYHVETSKLFGFSKERIRFISKDILSQQVIAKRLVDTYDKLSTWYLDEDILRYEKNILLYNENIKDHYGNEIRGINDIMRFDISRFTKKMDDQKVPLYRMNHGNLFGDKVYHVNIVVEFFTEEEKNINKIRLILTKKGIKRIEIPEFNINIYKDDVSKKDKNWFSLNKEGFLKNINKFI